LEKLDCLIGEARLLEIQASQSTWKNFGPGSRALIPIDTGLGLYPQGKGGKGEEEQRERERERNIEQEWLFLDCLAAEFQLKYRVV